jgi:hypothetical protein
VLSKYTNLERENETVKNSFLSGSKALQASSQQIIAPGFYKIENNELIGNIS